MSTKLSLTNNTRLDNINATGESLSNDDLKELIERKLHKDHEISVSEDEGQKKLTADFLKNCLATVTEIMDTIIQNDLNFDFILPNETAKGKRSLMTSPQKKNKRRQVKRGATFLAINITGLSRLFLIFLKVSRKKINICNK